MNTLRARAGANNLGLGLAGDLRQSTAITGVCQGGREHPSISWGTLQGFVTPLSGRELPDQPFDWIFAGAIFVVLLRIVRARGRAKKRLAEERNVLRAAAREAERHARQSEAALKQEIATLKHQVASFMEVPQEPLRAVGAKVRLAVPPDGSEVFLPLLDRGRVYEIAIQGTCKFSEPAGWFKERDAHADAFYRTDEIGNFLKPHKWLRLDDVPINSRFADREKHRYSFRIDGDGKKTSVRFHAKYEDLCFRPKGPLSLTVELLPEGTPSPAAAARREEAAREEVKEAERVARESAKRAEQVAMENSALHAKLESLKRQARFESHFLDPKFQQDFAKSDPAEMLKTRRQGWRKQYAQFTEDAALKTLAEQEAPEIIEWFEARVKIEQLAERVKAAPVPTPSAHEVREEMVRKKEQQYENMIAGAKLKGKKIAEAEAVLDELDLDEMHKEGLKTDLTEGIRYDGEEPENGNGNETL